MAAGPPCPNLVLLQVELFLDLIHEAGAEFLVLPVHGHNRESVAAPNREMTTSTGFKRATPLG